MGSDPSNEAKSKPSSTNTLSLFYELEMELFKNVQCGVACMLLKFCSDLLFCYY